MNEIEFRLEKYHLIEGFNYLSDVSKAYDIPLNDLKIKLETALITDLKPLEEIFLEFSKLKIIRLIRIKDKIHDYILMQLFRKWGKHSRLINAKWFFLIKGE